MNSSAGKGGVASVEIYNEHPYGSPEINRLKEVSLQLLRKENWLLDVVVVVVDDAEIMRLNRLFRGLDDVTDVIAFSGDEEVPGEIYISLDQARIQALEQHEPVQKAVERLLVHGLLHLGGWRDNTPEEREQMLEYGEHYLVENTTDPGIS